MSTSAKTPPGFQPDSATREPRAGWSAFRSGLLRPSAGALVGALLVSAAWCAGLIVLVTPEWVASPQGARLASGGDDRDLRVTSLVLGFAQQASLDRQGVFLLGASDLREALTSPKALQQLLPAGVQVFDLFSGWQSLLDTAALVEMFPPRVTGVAVVTVSPKRIAHGITYHIDFVDQPPFHRSLGFRSPVREEIAARENLETSFRSRSLLLDNYQFYLPRVPYLLANLFGPPPGFANHQWTVATGKPLTPERAALNSRELAKVVSGYEAQKADSFWMLERIRAMLEKRGARLILLEAPMAPRGYREVVGEVLLSRYRADMASFAAEHALEYWDLNPELGLDDEDFWDDQHVYSKRGRGRFTLSLARHLEPCFAASEETE